MIFRIFSWSLAALASRTRRSSLLLQSAICAREEKRGQAILKCTLLSLIIELVSEQALHRGVHSDGESDGQASID